MTSLSGVIFWMPIQPSRGAQKNLRRSQLVLGSVSSVNRCPASITATR
jgi:hypothetical protein